MFVAVFPNFTDMPSGKLARLLVIHFPERLVFLNLVKTRGILFLVLQIPVAALFSHLLCFGFHGSAASLCEGSFLSSSFGLPGSWRKLDKDSGEFVLLLAFSASSSALHFPLCKGARHSFVHQAFYFCSC